MKKGEIYVWNKKRNGKTPSRILCSVLKVTKKNVQIVRWDGVLKQFLHAWADPESLTRASEAEIRTFQSLLGDQNHVLQVLQA